MAEKRTRLLRAIEGTRDFLGTDMARLQQVHDAARVVFGRYGYQPIATPVFEDTRLFSRSIGETSDIVEKEMYTFTPGSETITLRPEGTAGVVRAFLQHHLHRDQGFWKLWYAGPMFRRERPQKGRYRQFHQVGVEAIGSADPLLDAECVKTALDFFAHLGLEDVRTRLSSIGCMDPACRPAYRERLREAVQAELSNLCENCRRRYTRNVLRVLDCKNPQCRAVRERLPRPPDHLCPACREHQRVVAESLRAQGVDFTKDPYIVRGLDYYTRTVFEFTHAALGAQDAIGGGGRYDGLVELLGGLSMPAVGFALGVDRVLLGLEARGESAPAQPLAVYGVAVGDEARAALAKLMADLHAAGLAADMDFEARSLKAQMKRANRRGARFALILGAEELAAGEATLRDMREGTQERVPCAQVPATVRRRMEG